MGDTIDTANTPFYEWGTGTGSTDSGNTPFYEWGRGVADVPGYNTDGTYTTPATGRAIVPADAAGGPPANYMPQILDVFKYGLGVWNQQTQQQALLDYKRFETTQLGTFMQGQPAMLAATNGRLTGSISTGMILIVVVAVLLLKGGK